MGFDKTFLQTQGEWLLKRNARILQEVFEQAVGLLRDTVSSQQEVVSIPILRACKREEGVYLYTQKHQSSVLSNLVDSNCLIDQPAGVALAEGDEVWVVGKT